MTVLDCSPHYTYRPIFIASAIPCVAPAFDEHRSRLFAGGTFFRSKLIIALVETQGTACNNISLEIIKDVTSPDSAKLYTLNVFYNSSLVETFPIIQDETASPACSGNPIGTLRANIASSNYISMPIRDTDINDLLGEDSQCLSDFSLVAMTGGDGGPTNASTIASIRTGPDRTIFIVSTTEDQNGNPVEPSVVRKVQQWDGASWITYIPNADCI
jgi:hypothetical protein